jgi:type II secretory pathway pseudopilin PulG
MLKCSNAKMTRGFTLVEVLVGTFLILIVFLGVFGAYQLGIKVVLQSKLRIDATALANQQLEMIRNLSYTAVGTQGASLPYAQGDLEPTTTTVRNNTEYTIETKVKYIVDEADGTGGADPCNWDYKRAEVKVSWSGRAPGEVKFSTDIAPKNKVEEVNACAAQPGGILSVRVFDAYGKWEEQRGAPLIEVFDSVTGIRIDFSQPTDGKHDFPLAASSYKVVVSKEGYSTEQTYGSGEIYQGQTIITPEKPHPIVLEGQLTENSFSIDQLSSMSVETRGTKGAGYPIVHNVTFALTGAKKVGLDADEKPIYKYSKEHTTNGPGQVDIPDLEWDSYSFSVITPDLDLVGIESPPGTEISQPVGLAPNSSLSVRLIVKAENSLLVTVQDIVTGEPIFSASVRLSNTGLGYDTTQYTDEKGETYFIPLTAATYNLEVEAAGYSSLLTEVSVSGDATEIIKLTQIE